LTSGIDKIPQIKMAFTPEGAGYFYGIVQQNKKFEKKKEKTSGEGGFLEINYQN
jgi:hypothetical protein